MKKMNEDWCDVSNQSTDECCLIAESMIDELHQIEVTERITNPTGGGRHKGSFKRRIMQQIRNARRLAMIG